ncbi:hypothetical protein BJY52DRAFT_1417216 [Lactarius psammicola]|nr:hypothetical protein BJY52DRAFT_1417216 [Lactarius psammicola]
MSTQRTGQYNGLVIHETLLAGGGNGHGLFWVTDWSGAERLFITSPSGGPVKHIDLWATVLDSFWTGLPRILGFKFLVPHKRASNNEKKGTDLAPPGASSIALSTEGIPKSISRVLDAARIRVEYGQKKRARGLEEDAHDDDATGGDALTLAKAKKRRHAAADSDANKSTIEIQPGESLKHFNRRVEDYMRPLVQSEMRASAATERKERGASGVNGTPRESKARSSIGKSEAEGTTEASDDKHRDRPKEFATISSVDRAVSTIS